MTRTPLAPLLVALPLAACAAPRAVEATLPTISAPAQTALPQVALPETAPPPEPAAWKPEPDNDLPLTGHSDLTPGVELQAYPAGVIATARVGYGITPRDVLHVRVGWNATDRQDFGERDDESGGGPGFGVGWRRYATPTRAGFLYGLRADLWWLEIDWEDDFGTGTTVTGETDVLVLQPAAEIGWAWRVADRWWLDLTASLGVELNVDTDGEDVGEGAILLLGGTLAYGF